jgi:hypothetical protein
LSRLKGARRTYGESPGFLLPWQKKPMIKNVSPIRQQLLLAVLILLFTRATGQQVAPVYPPQGGFHIEGDLRANTPITNAGDWISGPSGSGGYVLNSAGVPLDTATTIHIVDPWNFSGDDVFISGLANDNPNTDWTWTTGNTSTSKDINNVLLHFTNDSTSCHKWMIFAADRLGTSGISYVDFEFLQNTLTRNGNGTFTSVGPNDGRTVNDLLITVQYTNGGSPINIYFYKWDTDTANPGGYNYLAFIPPLGSNYGFTSSGGEPVPYTAFGQTTYLTNQFVEGMLDLDAIVQAYASSLDSVVFKTLTAKTKHSAPLTATLYDMIAPIQLNSLTIDCITGIEETQLQNTFIISPNPAQDKFTISMKEWNGKKIELTIFDVCERLVYEQEMHSQLSTVNCQLTKGLYFVKVSEGLKQFTQKLVID